MNSSVLTSHAFAQGIPFGDKIVTLAVVLFAISTAISWSFTGKELQIIYLDQMLLSITDMYMFLWSL